MLIKKILLLRKFFRGNTRYNYMFFSEELIKLIKTIFFNYTVKYFASFCTQIV